MIDWAAIRSAAAPFRLAMPRGPLGGRLGERLGAGAGSSLEFQDYRHYAPGDDLRHVDWAAYARSEILAVRLYREEVAPRVDLVIDVSRSMAVTEFKQRAYGAIAALMACASASLETDLRVITSGATEPVPLHRPEDIAGFLDCGGKFSALEEPHLALRRRSLRVAISDFLFPHDPDALVSRLARDGASLSVIQFTLGEEADPAVEGGRRLIDSEDDAEVDLVIDAGAVREYRERFGRLRAGLARASRRAGAAYIHVTAETSLREAARAMSRAGILESA
ncbi:MAG TPA: DUF58 domain-containing protein [Terriglobia bacterium]|nr:DUF58 domain-containing protein [Terriglobia bacterium]